MEGIQTIQALKAVQSSLPAQTTIPSDELVMLYAADGTPIAKIARDDLVKAVASVMASNSQTTFSKLLGVQANGTPMGIGASDLASVLGVGKWNKYIESVTVPGNGNAVFENFSSKGGYKIYCISQNSEGRCCLIALEWNNATIIWDKDSYFANKFTFSVSGRTLTLTNKTSSSVDLTIY